MKNTGGPAFPEKRVSVDPLDRDKLRSVYLPGMSLRDYFAAHASEEDIKFYQSAYGCRRESARYKHADDMILERAK
jgi:hypothetical protein